MTVNFQAEPFFDDYSEDKQFYRILFRPGYAVQARELTQMQTILQEQVRRHGDHIFKEGSLVIPGQISYDLEVYYVKLLTLANEDTTSKLNNLVGRVIKNDIGVSAKVLTYLRATDEDPYDTIFVKFISSAQTLDTLDQSVLQKNVFESQDQLNPEDVTGLTVQVAEVTGENPSSVGFASTASIERGIYYIKKHFVLVKSQTIVLDKYNNQPTYRVGLKLNEDAVYPEDDESLLDNSTGSPNYAAPGAVRYKMDLQLVKLNPQDQFGQDFIDLLRLENGRVIHKIDRSQYAELEKTLARRTYDESGDYALAPFSVQVREYRNNFRGSWFSGKSFIQGDIIRVVSAENALEYDYFVATTNGTSGLGPATPEGQPTGSWERYPQVGYVADGAGDSQIRWEYTTDPKFNRGVYSFSPSEDVFTINDHIRLDGMLALGIEKNKAYVKGYEIEKLSTEYFPVEKSRDLPEGSSALASYLGVSSLPSTESSVSLVKNITFPLLQGTYVVVQNVKFCPDVKNFSRVLLHDRVHSSVLPNGTSVIGSARIRALEKHSVQDQYKVFLFDVEMSNGVDFSECKSISPISGNSFKCDFVLENNLAVIKDPEINSLIYPIDYAVKEITRASYSVVAKLNASTDVLDNSVVVSYNIIEAGRLNNIVTIAISNSNGYTAFEVGDDIIVSGLTEYPGYVGTHTITNIINSGSISYISFALTGDDDQNTSESGTVKNVTGALTEYKLSFTVSSPYSFSSSQDIDNYTLINETNGHILNNGTLDIEFPEAGKLTIRGKSGTPITSTNFALLATLLISNNTSDFSYKAVVQDDSDSFTTSSEVQRKIIYLDQSYVTRIVSIKMNPAGFIGTTNNYVDFTEDITDRYRFDDGQTSTSAGRAFIELTSESQYPRGAIVVNYEYLKMSNEDTQADNGSFVSVESFTHVNSAIRYDQIPTFKNLQLRDCLDFRPLYSITGSGTLKTKYMPKYGSEISLEYKHYLPRIDNVALSSRGRYIISSGIPDLIPIEPGIPDNSMKIARILLEPYTFRTDQSGVIIEKTDNKRYTMRDIGKLERRIQDLEYYTSLSLLELDTKNMRVIDSSGLERYQNGFIVDNFVDQSVGNASSPEWNASIDFQNAELRPFFSQDQLSLVRTTQQSGNFVVNGDLVSLPFTEAVMIEQTSASLTENVNPFAVYSWRGTVDLNPWSDTWFETERRPDIVINDDGQYNAVVAKAQADGVLGTVWNSWQTVSTGASTTTSSTTTYNARTAPAELRRTDGISWGIRTITVETTAQDVNQVQTGTRTTVASRVDNQVIEDKILETRLIPYIRPRDILFNAYRFKPNTRLYAFFDGTNVDSYITSAVRLKVARIQNDVGGYYPHQFNVSTNVGDLIESEERLTQDNPNDAFSHGEVVREMGVGSNGHTAIVVGQEISGTEYFIYVVGVKNSSGNDVKVTPSNPAFSTSSNSYLEGEFLNGTLGYSRVRVLEVSPVVPVDSSALYSSPVGNAFGIFSIPNNDSISFRTGVRGFKLTDDISNNDDVASSHGSGFYEATGYLEVKQATVLSTRTAELVTETVSRNQTITNTTSRITADTGWYDPLAQTFLIQREGGAFITSVDLYFSTVDNNVPVIVEIREVVNGYPGRKVIPFSRVIKNGSEITTSANGSVAANFKFTSPVYLQNSVEYALVILSDSNQYRVFISQTDTIDLITQNRISSQPYNGVLFKSQNGSTWTADQTQDLKFKIYNAVFNTTPQTISFKTSARLFARLTNPFYFKRGTNKIRVFHTNHGMSVGDTAQILVALGSSITNTHGIPATEILGQHTVIKASADDYVIQVESFANSTGFGGGNRISSRIHRKFQVSNLNISQIEIPDTKITYSIKTTDDQPGSEISDTSEPILLGENYYYDSGKIARNNNSIIVTANLSTTNPNVSPIIDLGRAALTLISNKINNPTYIDNDLDLDLQSMTGLQNDITAFSISSGEATITTLDDHGFYDGQSVRLQIITSGPYAYLNDKFDITEIVSPNKFKFAVTAGDVQETALDGVVVPRSSEIGAGKPFVYDESKNSITALSTSTDEFAQLDKLQIGNILRFNYSSTPAVFMYMRVASKAKSRDESEITVLLEPEISGSAIRNTASGETVDIVLLSKYVSEIGTNIGTAISKYVTKKINLARQSEMLRIMFSAIIPNNSSIKLYYKTGNNSSTENFFNSKYIEARPALGYTTSTSFVDYKVDVEDINPFDTFVLKIVMTTTNPANVPRIKDFRVIACAA